MSKASERTAAPHVCHIVGGNGDGGMEQHALDLCAQLSKRWRVTLIAHPGIADRVAKSVDFVPLPDGARWNPLTHMRLRRVLRQVDAGIIHAQGNKAAEMLAQVRSGLTARTVGTLHSLKRNISMFEKMDAVIGVSQSVIERIKHPNAHVVNNGIAPFTGPAIPKTALQRAWSLPANKPLCVAAGRLVPVKAYDMLIQAWRNVDAGLAIIGDGVERDRLQRLIVGMGLEDRVILVGKRDDVRAILPSADLITISSEREGFSLVMLEALLAQTPVVSTRVPVCDETLPEAYLVPVGDPVAFAATVNRALEDRVTLAEAFAPVVARARETFTVDAMVARTEAVYGALLATS